MLFVALVFLALLSDTDPGYAPAAAPGQLVSSITSHDVIVASVLRAVSSSVPEPTDFTSAGDVLAGVLLAGLAGVILAAARDRRPQLPGRTPCAVGSRAPPA
ncbi:hypothetical protein M6D93_02050 [Jatrophihabitans telluris]|uniref:Sodium:proton antiporter n=1 Tax=Jatrophihabitans telluris TaxID=2038343 RepID=A0ABY4QZ75_9ACTN|nr:hypothetical protein [Jatrophihabitans telluris]UQX88795.1 hypothetical protein M6D93_02050 [Jatrophihabitans telluris]